MNVAALPPEELDYAETIEADRGQTDDTDLERHASCVACMFCFGKYVMGVIRAKCKTDVHINGG